MKMSKHITLPDISKVEDEGTRVALETFFKEIQSLVISIYSDVGDLERRVGELE